MRFFDKAFGITVAVFFLGAFSGVLVLLVFQPVREFMFSIFQIRILVPIRAATRLGSSVVMLLIFLNNSVPPILSFLYPLALAKIHWTPPLTRRSSKILLRSFTLFCSFLIGFFNLGAALTLASAVGGRDLVASLLSSSWLHGPLEFTLVLLCVAEPLRVVETRNGSAEGLVVGLQKDLSLLVYSLVGLMLSAAIEVFLSI